jgi:hypothetical protein
MIGPRTHIDQLGVGGSDTALKVVSAGPVISVSARLHPRTLPSATPSNNSQPLPSLACHGIQGLAAGEVCQSGSIVTLWIFVLLSTAAVNGYVDDALAAAMSRFSLSLTSTRAPERSMAR